MMDLNRIRDEFELVRNGTIFLNHAGTSPLSRRCADAMQWAVELNRTMPPDAWGQFQQRLSDCRNLLARMLNVQANEIAFSRNTTEGINWIANGIDWRPGDRIVTIRGEYPANIYPWMRLREKGITLHLIQPIEERVTLEQIEKELVPGTRLFTISFVQFASGFRIDLEAVGELCRKKGVLFFVDLIQGMGVFPLDLKKAHVDFAAGASQKWLLGPQGAGFFYCPHTLFNVIQPTCVGADTMAEPLPYLHYEYELRADTARFEYGTPPSINLIGLEAALNLFEEAGMENVCERVRILTTILVEGALKKGFHCHSPRGDDEWSGIVILTHPLHSNQTILKQLEVKNIRATEREGRIRLAPHFYQTEEEMTLVVDAL
ncbi:MAG: aminotransferase class V-fold PLP-dependent enzyme [Candidatus Omnitrophota bacterium]|jgi:selenocysteine lyase/cysteine desulfurase|nr:MAG: aminotransferase class V-fold PLP-dependent enzyme [Candidatus Omnitrophota bacterium]